MTDKNCILHIIYQIRTKFVGLFLPKKVQFEDKLDNSFTSINNQLFLVQNSTHQLGLIL